MTQYYVFEGRTRREPGESIVSRRVGNLLGCGIKLVLSAI